MKMAISKNMKILLRMIKSYNKNKSTNNNNIALDKTIIRQLPIIIMSVLQLKLNKGQSLTLTMILHIIMTNFLL